MTKKFTKELVQASLTNERPDAKKVEEIAKRLKRSDLKAYLRALKVQIARNSITITTARPVGAEIRKELTKLNGKNVYFKVDENKLFGVEVVDNDMVYDATLRKTFDDVVNFVGNP